MAARTTNEREKQVVNARLRLASSKGQPCITNGISQWQQFPDEEVLKEIQGSLIAYSLVSIIQVFNSVIATKKLITSRFQISPYNKFNTFFQYCEFVPEHTSMKFKIL